MQINNLLQMICPPPLEAPYQDSQPGEGWLWKQG